MILVLAALTIQGTGVGALGSQTPSLPHLRLQEVSATTVPPAFTLVGVAVSRDGTIAGWSAENTLLLLEANHPPTLITPLSIVHPVGVTAGMAHVVSFVDSSKRQIVEVGQDGRTTSTRDLGQLPIALGAAVAVGDAWYVAGRGRIDSTRYHVFLASEPSLEVGRPLVVGSRRLPPYLTASDKALVLAFTDKPYEVVAYDLQTGASREFEHPELPDSVDGRKAIWRGLPAIPLDSGVVQTFADLTSNKRILVLYAFNGSVVRVTAINAPLGLVDGDPIQHHLVAARRTDRVELVVYEWAWGRD